MPVSPLIPVYVQDLFFTTMLAAAMAFTSPLDKLPAEVPPNRFLTPQIILPVFAHFLVIIGFQVGILQILKSFDWYTPYEISDPMIETYSYENTVLFIVCLAQYVIASVVGPTFIYK